MPGALQNRIRRKKWTQFELYDRTRARTGALSLTGKCCHFPCLIDGSATRRFWENRLSVHAMLTWLIARTWFVRRRRTPIPVSMQSRE